MVFAVTSAISPCSGSGRGGDRPTSFAIPEQRLHDVARDGGGDLAPELTLGLLDGHRHRDLWVVSGGEADEPRLGQPGPGGADGRRAGLAGKGDARAELSRGPGALV